LNGVLNEITSNLLENSSSTCVKLNYGLQAIALLCEKLQKPRPNQSVCLSRVMGVQ
jgi:hypothetical protein